MFDILTLFIHIKYFNTYDTTSDYTVKTFYCEKSKNPTSVFPVVNYFGLTYKIYLPIEFIAATLILYCWCFAV